MKTVKKLVTHDGSFHSDDIFACATLCLFLEKNGEKFKIIRTRDEEEIKSGDYVFDVGGIYDEKTNRFDHHQIGGAGKRANGIEYAACGLVWKKFGIELCSSREVVDVIDQKLFSPIDAFDNGISLYKSNFDDVLPFTINDVMSVFSPTSLENMSKDEQFLKAISFAKEILQREIKKTGDRIEITKIIQDFYKNSIDNRIVVVDKPKVSRYEVWNALQDFSEPLFVIYGDGDGWAAVAMKKEKNSFINRKNFPKSWAGLKDEELENVTGVPGAVFCHRGLFLTVAKTKEGAIKLAQIAVES
jgi:uncharacterized UPF0160 family protein